MGERFETVFGERRARAVVRASRSRRVAVAGLVAAGVAVGILCALHRTSAPTQRMAAEEPRTFLDIGPSGGAVEPMARATEPAPRVRGPVCDVGVGETGADDSDGTGRIPPAQRAEAARRLDAALAVAPDPRARAAGRLLRLSALRGEDSDGAAQDTLADLAREAVQSDDPAVYAAALGACAHAGDAVPAACGVLNANRWSSLEPGNAAPWLRLAQDARAAGDDAGVAADVYQASIAARIDWHEHALALAALRAIPADASLLARTVDAHAIAQAADGWAAPAYGGLVAFCEPGADANRDQVCDAAASMLLRPGASAGELRLGARLGRSLAWPPDKLDELRLQREVLATAEADAAPDARAWDCTSAERIRQQAELRARLGESGARRALLAAAGRDMATEVERLRARRASRMARVDAPGDPMP